MIGVIKEKKTCDVLQSNVSITAAVESKNKISGLIYLSLSLFFANMTMMI